MSDFSLYTYLPNELQYAIVDFMPLEDTKAITCVNTTHSKNIPNHVKKREHTSIQKIFRNINNDQLIEKYFGKGLSSLTHAIGLKAIDSSVQAIEKKFIEIFSKAKQIESDKLIATSNETFFFSYKKILNAATTRQIYTETLNSIKNTHALESLIEYTNKLNEIANKSIASQQFDIVHDIIQKNHIQFSEQNKTTELYSQLVQSTKECVSNKQFSYTKKAIQILKKFTEIICRLGLTYRISTTESKESLLFIAKECIRYEQFENIKIIEDILRSLGLSQEEEEVITLFSKKLIHLHEFSQTSQIIKKLTPHKAVKFYADIFNSSLENQQIDTAFFCYTEALDPQVQHKMIQEIVKKIASEKIVECIQTSFNNNDQLKNEMAIGLAEKNYFEQALRLASTIENNTKLNLVYSLIQKAIDGLQLEIAFENITALFPSDRKNLYLANIGQKFIESSLYDKALSAIKQIDQNFLKEKTVYNYGIKNKITQIVNKLKQANL